MRSIEGRRGMPRPRPPFPAYKGLWEKPSVLNNVETWANVPLIVSRGADWFRQYGTEGGQAHEDQTRGEEHPAQERRRIHAGFACDIPVARAVFARELACWPKICRRFEVRHGLVGGSVSRYRGARHPA